MLLRFGILALWAAAVAAQSPSPGIHQEDITLHDFGSDEAAFLTLPAQPPRAGVILLPDALGSRPVVEQRATLLARMGYLCLALDLYDGREATTSEEAAALDRSLDARRTSSALAAALRLVLESPRYRCSGAMIAAWDAHLPALVTTLREHPLTPRVLLVSAIDPSPASTAALLNAGLPAQFIVRQETAAAQPRSAAGVIPYNLFDAPRGFMLDPADPPAAIEGWTLLLEAWNRRLTQPAAAAPTPMVVLPPADPAPAPTPSTPTAEPTRRPLGPRDRR